MEYRLDELIKIESQSEIKIDGKWVAARPIQPTGLYGFKIRLISAWKVLTGKVDTVVWPGGQYVKNYSTSGRSPERRVPHPTGTNTRRVSRKTPSIIRTNK